jgi:hypothetical protein
LAISLSYITPSGGWEPEPSPRAAPLPQVAKALGNLAMLYRERGELEDAAVLLQHALRLRERVLGGSHPSVAEILSRLALVHADHGAAGEASEQVSGAGGAPLLGYPAGRVV